MYLHQGPQVTAEFLATEKTLLLNAGVTKGHAPPSRAGLRFERGPLLVPTPPSSPALLKLHLSDF